LHIIVLACRYVFASQDLDFVGHFLFIYLVAVFWRRAQYVTSGLQVGKMAANGRGYMRPNSGGRAPPFLIIGLLVVIGILAFNYWSLSSKNSTLTVEVDEVEMRYRSTQARKLDVEKRNAELSTQLEDAKKYKQQAQEKDMRLREAEQKEKELNAKIDNLAGEAEVLKNDLNTCDDEVVRIEA